MCICFWGFFFQSPVKDDLCRLLREMLLSRFRSRKSGGIIHDKNWNWLALHHQAGWQSQCDRIAYHRQAGLQIVGGMGGGQTKTNLLRLSNFADPHDCASKPSKVFELWSYFMEDGVYIFSYADDQYAAKAVPPLRCHVWRWQMYLAQGRDTDVICPLTAETYINWVYIDSSLVKTLQFQSRAVTGNSRRTVRDRPSRHGQVEKNN